MPLNNEIIEAIKKQFGDLDATHVSAEEAIASRLLRDLDGYDTGSGWMAADTAFLANALVAYARLLQEHGVRA